MLNDLQTVETKSWSVDNVPAGTWVESRNLTYVKVSFRLSLVELLLIWTKIFNSSHMAPYDVPVVAHDMMLRFMGVNFSAIVEGSARVPSKVGDDEKPIVTVVEGQKDAGGAIPVPPGKSPEQDKAMWEGSHWLRTCTVDILTLHSLLQCWLCSSRTGFDRIGNRRIPPLAQKASCRQRSSRFEGYRGEHTT